MINTIYTKPIQRLQYGDIVVIFPSNKTLSWVVEQLQKYNNIENEEEVENR